MNEIMDYEKKYKEALEQAKVAYKDTDRHIKATIERIFPFISTLESEEQMNQDGLDGEIIKCWQEWVSPSNEQSVEGVLPLSEFAFYARHFAQWGAEHLKK